jgi:hypothetical protein
MADLIHISQLDQFVSKHSHRPALLSAIGLTARQRHQSRLQVSIPFPLLRSFGLRTPH